jgi:hypothetical protein
VSGYEELAEPTDGGDITSSSLYTAEAPQEVHRRTQSAENIEGRENLTMESLSLAEMSTPKARHAKKPSNQFETPYEKLHHQIQQQYKIDSSDDSISRPTAFDRYSAAENTTTDNAPGMESPLSLKSLQHAPSTPNTSTPREPPPSTIKRRSPSKMQGPLLHRVLDSNWRLQATPISKRSLYADIDALSSPPAPEITTQIYSPSPVSKLMKTPLNQRKTAAFDDSDDDSDHELGMSPPVTMQFSLPASKLVKTPARTAAMNIVEEVLRTAGAGKDTSLDSIKTPGRPIGGRKLSANPTDKEMWEAIRNAGSSSGGSSSKRKVDVNVDGSPFVQRPTLAPFDSPTSLVRGETSDRTAQSLGDWQESASWLN